MINSFNFSKSKAPIQTEKKIVKSEINLANYSPQKTSNYVRLISGKSQDKSDKNTSN